MWTKRLRGNTHQNTNLNRLFKQDLVTGSVPVYTEMGLKGGGWPGPKGHQKSSESWWGGPGGALVWKGGTLG